MVFNYAWKCDNKSNSFQYVWNRIKNLQHEKKLEHNKMEIKTFP